MAFDWTPIISDNLIQKIGGTVGSAAGESIKSSIEQNLSFIFIMSAGLIAIYFIFKRGIL